MCRANITAGLISEVATADMMLHVGDFGYNMETYFGLVGDQFMRNIEQLAASVPYMVRFWLTHLLFVSLVMHLFA